MVWHSESVGSTDKEVSMSDAALAIFLMLLFGWLLRVGQ
jgi:hypothetical protein